MMLDPSLKNNRLHSTPQSPNQSLDPSYPSSLPPRSKLHSLMSQNFTLKEYIDTLQTQLNSSQANISDLKDKLRSALQQISASDRIISDHIDTHNQLRDHSSQLQDDVRVVRAELEAEKEAVRGLMEHNKNLQTQALLVGEIKQKYQMEHCRCKLQLESAKTINEQLAGQNSRLSVQIDRMLQQLDQQQLEVDVRRAEMEEYERFVLDKLNEAKTDPEFHQQCLAEKDRYYCKYLKYKERYGMVKRERDQLLQHLQEVGDEVGSRSMRKYVG